MLADEAVTNGWPSEYRTRGTLGSKSGDKQIKYRKISRIEEKE